VALRQSAGKWDWPRTERDRRARNMAAALLSGPVFQQTVSINPNLNKAKQETNGGQL
jgi:hypothetical protein